MVNIFLLKKLKEDKERYEAIVKEIDSIVAYEECKAMKDKKEDIITLCREISKVIRTRY